MEYQTIDRKGNIHFMECQKRIRIASLIFLLLMLLSFTVSAADFPIAPDSLYCSDFSGVIGQETVSYIVEKGDRLYRATGAQIVIVTMDSLAGMSIADYTAELAARWQIGAPDRANGIMLLMDVKHADYYMVQGSGIAEVLTEEDSGALLENYLEPYFSVADYDGGARSIYDALFSALCRIYDYDGISDIRNYQYANEQTSGEPFLIIVFLVLLFAFLLFFVLWILSAVSRSMYFSRKPIGPFWRLWYPLLRPIFWRRDPVRRRKAAGSMRNLGYAVNNASNHMHNPQPHHAGSDASASGDPSSNTRR